MKKQKCKRCGAMPATGDAGRLESNGLIEDEELWIGGAGKWCKRCQKEFLRTMGDCNDKYWDSIEAQDRKEWERNEFRHLVRKDGLKLRPGGSFDFPISGHMPRKLKRRFA